MGKYIAIVLTFSILTSGCSLLTPHSQDFSARCSEPDAKLFINNAEFQGHGTARVKRNKTVSVMCTKDGYKATSRTVEPTISGPGLADAIGTVVILLPGIGFLSPGAWKLGQDTLNLTMDPE